ncbi:MAG: beta-glucosidase BglX [Planctomycetota bacterium]
MPAHARSLSAAAALLWTAATPLAVAQDTATVDTAPVSIDELVGRMTMAEKAGQLNMLAGLWDVTGPVQERGPEREKYEAIRNGKVGAMLNVTGVDATRTAQRIAVEESRLGIPLLFGYDVVHGYETMFPTPLAEACSWDLDLMRRTAAAAAIEATDEGIHWTFAPMVDVSRDARWGRVVEGAGEDPYLGSKIAVARVRGFQGEDLADPQTVAACLKHFAAYGFAEAGRDYNTVDISRMTLQNVVMPPFRAGVDAGAVSVMTAFNEVNGIPATADRAMLRGVLRKDLGFGGLVLSDYGSCQHLVLHGYASNLKEAARMSLEGGCDMDMEGNAYASKLEELVKSGVVPESLVDQSVYRVLDLKQRLGLFDDPYRYCGGGARADAEAMTALSREAGRKSIVLLHNRDNALPIAEGVGSIAVIGPLADDRDAPLGTWRAKAAADSAVTVLEGVQAALGKHAKISHAEGCRLLNDTPRGFALKSSVNETDLTGIEEAAELAAESDLVLLVVGEDCYQSGEARSRARIDLPGVQPQLVKAVTAANPNTVILLMSGRPLAVPEECELAAAVLQVWHLGSQSGHAIADVLTGAYNPSAKLAASVPRSVGQAPIYYNHKNTGRPGVEDDTQVWYSHYEDESNEPLFPFGHGLSYTTFKYSNLKLSDETFTEGETLTVTADVKNIGERAGVETAQLYLRDPVASRTRPVLQLRGFEQVSLEPGESATVEFVLQPAAFGFRDETGNLLVEPGEFRVFVGGSSESLLRTSCRMEPAGHSSAAD